MCVLVDSMACHNVTVCKMCSSRKYPDAHHGGNLTIKVEEWGHLWLVRNGFHLLSDLATLKHTTLPQSNLICKFCSSLSLNETDKVTKSVVFVNLPLCASLRFVFCLRGRINDDRITVKTPFQRSTNFQPQNYGKPMMRIKILNSEMIAIFTFCFLKWYQAQFTVFWSTDAMWCGKMSIMFGEIVTISMWPRY